MQIDQPLEHNEPLTLVHLFVGLNVGYIVISIAILFLLKSVPLSSLII